MNLRTKNPPPKHHPSQDAMLAYASGQADTALRLLVEVHLDACDTCAREAGALAEPGGAMLLELRPQPLPPSLFDRIAAALPGSAPVESEHFPLPDLALPGAVQRLLPPPAKRDWRGVLKRGVRFLRLLDGGPGTASLYLLHLDAGSRFPRHTHGGMEDAVLLAGGATDGKLTLEAGDWRHMDPGTGHEPRANPDEACWLLVRVEGEGVEFSGWRRLLPSS